MTEKKETHTVATDALATIGTIIDETAGRDAIHLAVAPARAKMTLYPSQRVSIDPDTSESVLASEEEAVGIVDPFLREPVYPGQWFWLVLKPRTITSLRHVWEHPAFPEKGPEQLIRSHSEQWMRRWAMAHMGVDYYGEGPALTEDQAYENAIEAGRRMSVGPYEDAREFIDHEWWNHWENITGERGQRGDYFSCSC